MDTTTDIFRHHTANSYGTSYERYPINDHEIWEYHGSKIAVCDLTKALPKFMYSADMIYCDPPWTLGNVNMFNTKGGRERMSDFEEFIDPFFRHIGNINPKTCYIQAGLKTREIFTEKLQQLQYPSIQYWFIKYYKKFPCILIRGGQLPTTLDYDGYDDTETPAIAIMNERPYVVGDLCAGRGLTGIAALEHGFRFVGTELIKRKLAVFIERADKKGYSFRPC